MRRRVLSSWFTLGYLALSLAICFGGTLRVPQDFPTVQAAVDASGSGDVILIAPGAYAVPGRPCTLANNTQKSCGLVLQNGTTLMGSGPAQTELDFAGAPIGILLQTGSATVKLLHLRNAINHVFSYQGSDLIIKNVIVTNPAGSGTVGLELNQGNSYSVQNVTIDGISIAGDPAAVAIDVPFGGTSNVQNNLVTNSNRGITVGSFSGSTYAFNTVFGSADFNWGVCNAVGCTSVLPPLNNMSADPLYCPDFTLQAGSPAIRGGNPAILNPDGTRSDMGAYGGPDAIPPPLMAAPCVIDFGDVPVGTASSPRAVRLRSTISTNQTVTAIAPNNALFAVTGATLPSIVGPLGIATFAVTFSPQQLGDFAGEVQVATSNPFPTSMRLRGRGVATVLPGLGSTNGPGAVQASLVEPVSTGNGNYYYQHTDFVIPGRGMPLVFRRTYNALDTYIGPVGAHWTHNYNIFLTQTATAAIVKWGDGHGETFTLSGSTYLPQAGVFSSLAKNPDGTFVLTRKDQTRFMFSVAGKLTTVQDRNTNTIALTYSGGNLTQIIDTVGRTLTLTYDMSNHIIQITDFLGRTASFVYTPTNDLASVTDPAGGATRFAYDAAHHVVSITQPNGQILLQNVYDSAGRVTSQTNGRGFTTTFAYGAPPGDTTITDARGSQTIHSYDSSLRIIRITDALGGITQFSYDANNDRTSVTNPNGKTTSLAYDARGNVTSITDPLGNTIGFSYDAQSNLLAATNAKGKTTSFAYDVRSNLTRITDAAGSITQFAYDGLGQLISKTDARSSVSNYVFDARANLTRITDALGNATNLAYDAIGRLGAITDPKGQTARASYDGLSRLVRIADPLGNQTQFAYDAVGNLLRILDANGHGTTYGYDAANNLVTVTDALGNVTRYSYDPNNNRGAFTNAKGNTTAYAYDSLNRLIRATDPLSFMTSYTYDPTGNVATVTDANGKTNRFGYDAVNRLLAITYADGKNVGYLYDANGNRTSMVDSLGSTAYVYDVLDRLLSVSHPGGKTVSYAYDAVGNRKSLTYADGKVVQYAYDNANRLAQATDWLGRNTRYTYDAASSLTKTLYPNNTNISFSYDGANRLIGVVNSALGLPLLKLDYTLDAVGNRRTLGTDGFQTIFGYDALNQLVSAQLGFLKTTWTYDAVGNRLQESSPLASTTYSYDVADRLLSARATTFSYDGNGNQITKATSHGTLTYTYDAANRLTKALGLGVNSAFAYDGDGNRVTQTAVAGTYSYVNDVATALPVVLDEQGPDGAIRYAYGLGLIEASSSQFNFFYHYDGLGSVVALTDGAGRPRAAYAYDAWGNPLLAIRDSEGAKNKFRFTGEALDPGTGLYFLRARYYDPSTGRFISHDHFYGFVTSPQTLQYYVYASNNPINLVDPSGLFSFAQVAANFADLGKSIAVEVAQSIIVGAAKGAKYAYLGLNDLGQLVPAATGGIKAEVAGWRILSTLPSAFGDFIATKIVEYVVSNGGNTQVKPFPILSYLPFVGPAFIASPAGGDLVDTGSGATFGLDGSVQSGLGANAPRPGKEKP